MVCYIIACHWLKKNYEEKKTKQKEKKRRRRKHPVKQELPTSDFKPSRFKIFSCPSHVCSLDPSDGFTVSASVLNQPLCDGVVIKLLAAQSTEQVCIASLNFYFINLNKKISSLCWP